MTPHPAPDQAAWSWVEHVRTGGTTPWAQWTPPPPATPEPTPGRLPGAAQLEVVRRLAERRATATATANIDFPRLADLVLERTGPGRGLGEIPLVGDPSGARLGTPAIDPSEVPVAELIRICVGALCELLIDRPPLDETPPRPGRWPWAKGFHLAGPPVVTASLRAAFAGAGLVEGGRKPRVVIVAGTLDDMLRDVWTARVQRGTSVRWPKFVARSVREDRLPVQADLAMVAAHWAGRVGADRVHVVAPPHDDAAVRRTAAAILGVTAPAAAEPRDADLLPVPPQGVDVLRRLNAVLDVRVEPALHRPALRAAALHLLGDGAALAVPRRYADWARQRSLQMTGELRAGGYAVHGDLQRVVSRRTSQTHDHVHGRDVLDIALNACLSAAQP